MDRGRRKLKVLFLIRSLGFGGAERQLSYLAKGLVASGHEVRVAVYYAEGPYLADLMQSGVTVVSLEKRGRWDLVSFVWRLLRLIRREHPAVVYGFMPTENLACLLATWTVWPRIPVVWGVRASGVDVDMYGALPKFVHKLQKLLVPAADLVISNSMAGLVSLGLTADAGRNKVIPNGIDVMRFHPDGQLGLAGRAMLNVRVDQPLVAIVGRLDPMKGHDCFLRAAACVAERFEGTVFLIVGSGEADYRTRLFKLAEDLGISSKILWSDATPDVELIYNAIDVLVSSSIFGEGFSNVVAEAMACGAAIVACDVGDTARIVGSHGRLVRRNDPAALAAAVIEALHDRGQRNTAGYDWVAAEFGIDTMVNATETALLALQN